MYKYFLNHRRIFYAGNDFYLATTLAADLNIYIEDPLQALSPRHGRPSLKLTPVLWLIRQFALVVFTPVWAILWVWLAFLIRCVAMTR